MLSLLVFVMYGSVSEDQVDEEGTTAKQAGGIEEHTIKRLLAMVSREASKIDGLVEKLCNRMDDLHETISDVQSEITTDGVVSNLGAKFYDFRDTACHLQSEIESLSSANLRWNS